MRASGLYAMQLAGDWGRSYHFRRMTAHGAASLGRDSWDTWPTYDAAVLGFRDYWYPVIWSRSLGRKPLAFTLLGEKVMLVRDAEGKPRALVNRCPHRGVPLSLGRQE